MDTEKSPARLGTDFFVAYFHSHAVVEPTALKLEKELLLHIKEGLAPDKSVEIMNDVLQYVIADDELLRSESELDRLLHVGPKFSLSPREIRRFLTDSALRAIYRYAIPRTAFEAFTEDGAAPSLLDAHFWSRLPHDLCSAMMERINADQWDKESRDIRETIAKTLIQSDLLRVERNGLPYSDLHALFRQRVDSLAYRIAAGKLH